MVLWVGFAPSGTALAAAAEDGGLLNSSENRPAIEGFLRQGCPHCEKAKEFLGRLSRERPDIRIVLHDVGEDPSALDRLRRIAEGEGVSSPRVPAFVVRGQLILGFSDQVSSGRLIMNALAGGKTIRAAPQAMDSESCEAEESLQCGPGSASEEDSSPYFAIQFLGRELSLERIGLPLFTLAMGLADGFNPCSMWVLLLMISLLAPMNNRLRMFAVAGTFIAVEGAAYFVFMAAWLNLFLFIGLSRASELIIAAIALVAGGINLKDFWAFGAGVSLSIPSAAKPGVYARIRGILQAKNLAGALIGAAVLAILVQIVEFMCTSGFPALYTRILTLRQPDFFGYYGYLLLYNLAYMLDDVVVLAVGIVTLSQRRLQEKEGRWLKLASGLVMAGLGIYLLLGSG